MLTNSDHDSYFTVAPMFVLAPVLVLSQGGCLLTPPSPRCATISLGYSSQSWVSWVPNLWCQTLGVSDPEYQVLGAKRYGCHTVFGIELGCPILSPNSYRSYIVIPVGLASQTILGVKRSRFSSLSVFTARSSLSDKRVACDKTEERSVQVFIPYERSFSLVF